ncbi:amino acid ABC transporter substrate-binding protein [Dellaglioa carnosa]|uniref:Amino acid ABC transporter substrate-binding protein n=1 Tax=Dellaglioa carnosa TaxID=2995136 RepID=A0ABT4JKD9_9LACO|nr:amino acid ABC transporter substrate-binding protein [Dellaglioa carnosa]MCZ2490745.1 amino acid ABC transporter substrate-binding protein [Dellaglioa carnosa]MCZ2493823.1 amino acid ABC transporter substrate-binding protein [Dellaglioa carnosa]MDK1730687.1 amino acid ABC transporter substrate-binding protein [Dellaglioa carnosa]
MTQLIKKIVLSMLLLVFFTGLTGCSNDKMKDANQSMNLTDDWKAIQQKGTVVIGIDDSFVPMTFRQKDGKLVGYDVDLAKKVFEKYGIKVDFQTIDWSMKETELKNGTIDLIWNGYTKTTARAKTVAFSRTYLTNKQVVVTKKSSEINSFSEMKNKILGVQSGSAGFDSLNLYPNILKNKIQDEEPIQYDSFDNAFIDLNADRIQGLLIDDVYANYFIEHQTNSNSYRVIDGKFKTEDFAVGLRKSDVTMKLKINKAITELQNEGYLKKLNHKWFGEDTTVRNN